LLPLHDDQPTREKPIATVFLIIVCVLIFGWQLTLQDWQKQNLFLTFGVVPAVLVGPYHLPPENQVVPSVFTLFSSMFLHGGWLHIAGNMLYLWIFGNNVEDAMGHRKFLLFYLACGVVAGAVQCVATPGSSVPMIGASGAVAGTLGAYLLLHPRARVLTFVFLGIFWTFIRLPAAVVLGGWIIIQIFNGMGSAGQESGVAWMAHVGGFMAGVLLIGLFKRRSSSFFWKTPGRR